LALTEVSWAQAGMTPEMRHNMRLKSARIVLTGMGQRRY
jgi:hypothetical protein